MLGWSLIWLTGEVRSQEADLPHNQYEQRASVTDVAIDLIGLSLGPTLAAGGKFPSGIGFSFPLNISCSLYEYYNIACAILDSYNGYNQLLLQMKIWSILTLFFNKRLEVLSNFGHQNK